MTKQEYMERADKLKEEVNGDLSAFVDGLRELMFEYVLTQPIEPSNDAPLVLERDKAFEFIVDE